MFRQVWQRQMISLALSSRWKNFMQSRNATSRLARRYVGGKDPASAIETAKKLRKRGIYSSLFYLGEYVTDWELAAENIRAKEQVMAGLTQVDLDLHVSVDPTQIGCGLDWPRGARNIEMLARRLTDLAKGQQGTHCLMFDMEDFSVNERTINLHDQLRKSGSSVALTLQAYLHKTEQDMRAQITAGGMVRLVKGAFAEDAGKALAGQEDIKENYRKLMSLMLSDEARQNGFYPIFATHDTELHQYGMQLARQRGWAKGSYEFEMLYGARDDVAEELALKGEKIRLYLPFGSDWWPYAVRRIGENPRNALLLARGIMGM